MTDKPAVVDGHAIIRPVEKRGAAPMLRFLSKNIAYVAFILLVVFFSITAGDKFLSMRNWSLILEQAPVLTLIALGMTFVITAGFIDLSVGSSLGLACLVGALGAQWLGFPGILLGILTGTAIGFLNGILFDRLRIPSFIVTLAMMVILRALVAIISGGFAVYLDQVNAGGLALLNWIGRFPQVAIITLVIAAIATLVYNRGVFGRNLMAIGGDERAVARFGVSVSMYRIMTMALSGFMVGLASVVSLAQFGAAGPLTGTGTELQAISAVVLGGTPLTGGYGSTVKTVIGSLALVVLADGLTLMGVPPSWTDVVRGVILIVAVAVALERGKIGVVK
jgi:ribose/xylose/arabinose/galactoside ABC-type transport system permease subunit